MTLRIAVQSPQQHISLNGEPGPARVLGAALAPNKLVRLPLLLRPAVLLRVNPF